MSVVPLRFPRRSHDDWWMTIDGHLVSCFALTKHRFHGERISPVTEPIKERSYGWKKKGRDKQSILGRWFTVADGMQSAEPARTVAIVTDVVLLRRTKDSVTCRAEGDVTERKQRLRGGHDVI